MISKQPQAFRAFQRAEGQKLAQRPAGGFRLRPLRRRHRAFAVPITRLRHETALRAATARIGAIAPKAEQRALRLRQISVAVAVGSTLHCVCVIRCGNGQFGALTFRRMWGSPSCSLRSGQNANCEIANGEWGIRAWHHSLFPIRYSPFAIRHSPFAAQHKSFPRRDPRPSSASHQAPKIDPPPAQKREAERRKAHFPSNVRVKRGCAPFSSRPRLRGRVGRRHAAFRRSRLRHSPPALTPMAQPHPEPGFPTSRARGCFARLHPSRRLSTLRADRSLCRSTGDPGPPECGLAIPPAGTAPRSAFQACLPERRPR